MHVQLLLWKEKAMNREKVPPPPFELWRVSLKPDQSFDPLFKVAEFATRDIILDLLKRAGAISTPAIGYRIKRGQKWFDPDGMPLVQS
jgi:hypothetical protein